MNIRCEVKLIQIFGKLADIRRARWLCQLADGAEFLEICIQKICARLTQPVQSVTSICISPQGGILARRIARSILI